MFQLEAGATVGMGRPVDAFGPQRICCTYHIENVPAPAIVLPLARIRIDQIAPEHEARDFIIKTDRVVTDADGAARGQRLFDDGRELVFRHATLQADLRRDAGDQAGLRVGQEIRRGPAVMHDRFADFI